MFHKIKKRCLFILIISFIFIGCTSTIHYTPEDICEKPLNPEMARVIVKRTFAVGGGGAPALVNDNLQPIGDVGNADILCWDRYPGKCYITVKSGNQPPFSCILNTKKNEIHNLIYQPNTEGLPFYEDKEMFYIPTE